MNLPIRIFGLAVVLTLAACDAGTDPPGGGGNVAATGTLNNSFDRPVDGAAMTFTSAAAAAPGAAGRSAAMPTFTATTSASGAFSLQIPPGTYAVAITHPAYGTLALTATVAAGGAVTFSAPASGPGGLATVIVNALNGQAVAGATAYCSYQRPDGSYNGGPSATQHDFRATSSATGQISVTGIPYGAVRCTATTAFGPVTIDLPIAATGTTSPPTTPAVPLPAAGEFRVVLTWGANPRDLDSHVTGPGSQGGRFHVYYASSTAPFANLDLDDTSGEGPETVTITATAAAARGMYRYSVHNFSDQSATGAAGIAGSPSTVRLYGPTGLLKTYTAPAVGTTTGNTWRVFELTINQDATFTLNDGNGASLRYVTATGAGDMGTFLTGGPDETPMPKGITL